MRFKSGLCCLLLSASLGVQAQYYQFQLDTATYQNLVNPTLLVTETWDDPDWILPTGMNFTFFGLPATTLYSSEDFLGGFVGVVSASNKVPLILADGADIIDRGNNTGQLLSPISWQRQGPPGNQILKIEWKNVGFFSDLQDDGISQSFTNFQLWLYESDQRIELRYGPQFIADPSLCYEEGMGPLIALIKFIDLNSGSFSPESQILTGQAASPLLSPVTDPDLFEELKGTPEEGTVYRFTRTTSVASEPFSASGLVLFPNPATDWVTVKSEPGSAFEGGTVVILDALGRPLAAGMTNQPIPVADLATGIYTVQALSMEGSAVASFIKG